LEGALFELPGLKAKRRFQNSRGCPSGASMRMKTPCWLRVLVERPSLLGRGGLCPPSWKERRLL
jgi:hypothetical protein